MGIKNFIRASLVGLIVLVLVSCTIIILLQEDNSFDNPIVLAASIIGVLWILLLLPAGFFFSKTINSKLENLILASLELSEGNTKIDIELSDKNDEFSILNDNLELIRDNIEQAAIFASETGNGNLNQEFQKAGENDLLGSALISMKDKLKEVALEENNRSWFNEGVAQFSDILRRNNNDLDLLTSEIISNLVNKVDAQQGTIFIKHETNGHETMVRKATYAYDREKYVDQEIEFKEGIVGQVWAESKPTYIENVPSNYAEISSGLGKTPPNSLFIIPLFVKDNVMGIIEIASINKLEQFQKDFIIKISESIAGTLDSVQTNTKTAKLLEESQKMQKEMADQEEMMKQSMEEMRATQEQMQEQESELKTANREAKKANDEMRESQRQLESRINILNEMCLVSVTDRKGVITEVNSKFMEVAKYQEEELIGQPHNIVRHPDMPAEIFKLMWQTIGKGQPFRGMVKNLAKDGSTYWVDAVINPIVGEDGKPQGYIGVRYLNTDIIQQQETYTYDLGDVQLTVPTK